MSREDSTIVPQAQGPHEDPNPSRNSPENQQKPRRRRNKPGNPDPGAKVIALSPGELLAKVVYMCLLCRRVFQTKQKLQVHQRSHKIPWVFRHRDRNGLKPVYVCPEPTCVHHDPRRALSDITGIKKHYSRKHCEPKLQCKKCRKMYAVETDLKAHSKICSTYRCECGAVFPRREEYDAHRQLHQSTATGEEMGSPGLVFGAASNSSFELLLWLSQMNPPSNHPLDMEGSTMQFPPVMSAVESLTPLYSTTQTHQAGMVSEADLVSTTPVQHEEVAGRGGLLGWMGGQQQNEFQGFARETPYFHQVINLTEQPQGIEFQDPVVSSSFPFEIPNMQADYVGDNSIGFPAPTECQGGRMAPPIYSSVMAEHDQGGLMTVPYSGLEVQPEALPPLPSPTRSQLEEFERLLLEEFNSP